MLRHVVYHSSFLVGYVGFIPASAHHSQTKYKVEVVHIGKYDGIPIPVSQYCSLLDPGYQDEGFKKIV